MASKQVCNLCGEYLEETPAIHNLAKCERTELLKSRKEIKKLKVSIEFWKNSWHEGRNIIGWLWWNHPAIMNDERLVYYRNQHTKTKE